MRREPVVIGSNLWICSRKLPRARLAQLAKAIARIRLPVSGPAEYTVTRLWPDIHIKKTAATIVLLASGSSIQP